MMKKKFVIGLLIATLGIGSVSLTSCKDTNEDNFQQMQGENAALKKTLDELRTKLEACADVCKANMDEKLKNYFTKSETYSQEQVDQMLNDYQTIEAFNKWVEETLDQEVNDILGLTPDQVGNLKDIVESLGTGGTNKENLDDLLADATELGKLADKAEDLLKLLNQTPVQPGNPYDDTAIKADIKKLQDAMWGEDGKSGAVKNILDLQERVDGISEFFKDANGNPYTVEKFRELVAAGQWVIDNKTAADAVLDALTTEAGEANDALKALTTWYSSFETLNTVYNSMFPEGLDPYMNGQEEWYTYTDLIHSTQTNYVLITDCQKELQAIWANLNNMVTSLEIHTAWNPAFGGFNTPFGISSNMLMTFYGKADNDINFPAQAMDDAGISGNPFADVLNGENVPVGGWIHQNNLGTLYFTVNPVAANVYLDNFKFENSIKEAAPVTLTVKPSDKLLTMGFSRAYSGNGFYEVTATLDEDNQKAGEAIQAMKIRVEDGMLQAAKEVWRNRTLGSVAALAAKVYNQMKDVCPAYALRYDWTNPETEVTAEKSNAVLSRYCIAVTAAKPLSFTTLRNSPFSSPFPTIKPIQIDKSMVDLGFADFEVGKVQLSIAISGIDFGEQQELNITVRVPSKFDVQPDGTATLPSDWDVDGSGYYDEITVPTDQIDELIANMQDSVNKWINGDGTEQNPGVNKQIEDALNEALYGKGTPGEPGYEEGLISSIESQVNTMMGNIQDKLDNLVDEVNGDKYLGKLNKIIDKYNQWNDRLSHVLSQPNHYMQVAMFYNLPNDGTGMVSNAEGSYTPFKWNGGEGFNLWATTFNFETVAPAYKKFVAVTKISKDGVDITTPALLAKANSSNTMATILDGNQKAVTVTTKDVVERGHVYAYEITYRAVDFHGKTSTARYYISIDAK